MRRWLLGVALMLPGIAHAQASRQEALTWCEGADSRISPARQLAGCGWMIRAEGETQQNRAIAFNNRGNARAARGDHAGATADYDQAIGLDPLYAPAFDNRGLARAARGDHAAAVADHAEAIRLDPRSARAFDNRGIARSALGDDAGAIADHDQAISLDPGRAGSFYHRGAARLAQGDPAAAIADQAEAIRLDPRHADAFVSRGDARRELGDRRGAIADYGRAIRIDPRNMSAFNNRGDAYRAAGRLRAALADFDAAVRVAPRNVTALVNRCITGRRLHRAAAMRDCTRAAALAGPGQGWPLAAMAGLDLARGRLAGVAGKLRSAMRREAGDATYFQLRAILRQRRGDVAGSIADAATAHRLDPRAGARIGEVFGLALR